MWEWLLDCLHKKAKACVVALSNKFLLKKIIPSRFTICIAIVFFSNPIVHRASCRILAILLKNAQVCNCITRFLISKLLTKIRWPNCKKVVFLFCKLGIIFQKSSRNQFSGGKLLFIFCNNIPINNCCWGTKSRSNCSCYCCRSTYII